MDCQARRRSVFDMTQTSLAKRLARANRELREVHRIGVELMYERDLPVLLHRIVSTAKSLTASDGCALFLADQEKNPPDLLLDRFECDSIPRVNLTRAHVPIDDTS